MKFEIDNPVKRVSYILITKNKASYLDKALDNIREFITPDDELIVMDGGSTDNTAEVIKKNADIVTIFESEKDYGGAHALNKGILKCRGRYIVNLTDDDYFFPVGIKKAIQLMEREPEIDALLCGGENYRFEKSTGKIELINYQYLPPSKTLSSDIRNCIYYTSAGFFILRKRIIARVGLFDNTVQVADTEYSSRLILNKANFKYFNVKMYRHVNFPHSWENNMREARRDHIKIAIDHKLWGEVFKKPWSDIIDFLGLIKYPKSFTMINFLVILLRPCRKLYLLCKSLKNRKITKLKMCEEPDWDESLR